MELRVTENKSTVHAGINDHNMVRVFVDRDFTYGYWINERTLVEEILTLDEADCLEYLNSDTFVLDVDVHTAQRVIDAGATPFTKRVLPGATAYAIPAPNRG